MPDEPAPRAPVVPLGTAIARRELRTAAGDAVVVVVGAPVHVGEGWDWACPFRIEGPGDGAVVDAQVHGSDALQALQLVTPAVRGALERAGVPLRWLDSDFWEAGFPRSVEALGSRALEAELHAVLDAATAGWLEREVGRRGGAASASRGGADRDDAAPWGGDAAPAGPGPERPFGCPTCWPASPASAWAARASLERGSSPIDEPHLVATLLRCRACGQDFLSLFAERVDWSRGEDPQVWTLLPLTAAEAARLATGGPPDEPSIATLGQGRRSLRREHPSDGPVHLAWSSGVRVDPHD